MQIPIRLILADDHAVFREGLKSLLATYDRFEVVAEVARSSDLEAIVSNTPCEVVVLDLQMDQWVMGEIEWLCRRATVVVLTASENAEDAKVGTQFGGSRCGAEAVRIGDADRRDSGGGRRVRVEPSNLQG